MTKCCALLASLCTSTFLRKQQIPILLVSLHAALVLLQREAVSSLKHIRCITRAVDVALLALPLRLVDGINPVLNLHDNAAVLLDSARARSVVEQTLGLFESEGAVLAAARVDLEGFLLGVDVNLDAGPVAGEGCDGSRVPVVRAVLGAVDEVAGVIAGAVGAAVAEEVGGGEVGADLLGRGPEVVDVVLLVGQDGAVGDQNAVGSDALARVGHVQGVVESERRLRVLETVQIPVGVRGKHDGSLVGSGDGRHVDVPLVRSHGVGNVGDDLAGEALLTSIVDERESDAVWSVGDHGPVAPVPAICCCQCQYL